WSSTNNRAFMTKPKTTTGGNTLARIATGSETLANSSGYATAIASRVPALARNAQRCRAQTPQGIANAGPRIGLPSHGSSPRSNAGDKDLVQRRRVFTDDLPAQRGRSRRDPLGRTTTEGRPLAAKALAAQRPFQRRRADSRLVEAQC